MNGGDRLTIIVAAAAVAATVASGTCSTNSRFESMSNDIREIRSEIIDIRERLTTIEGRLGRVEGHLQSQPQPAQ